MGKIMLYKDAAKIAGLSPTELYSGLRSGRYPGYRAGSNRGRWLVDLELLEARIHQLMEENITQRAAPNISQYGQLRKIQN